MVGGARLSPSSRWLLRLVCDPLDADALACLGGAQATDGDDAVGVVLRYERNRVERLPVLREAHGAVDLLCSGKSACLEVESEEHHRRCIHPAVDAFPRTVCRAA